MDLCLDLELGMGIIQEFFSLKFSPNKKKFCQLGLSFNLDQGLSSRPTHLKTMLQLLKEIP